MNLLLSRSIATALILLFGTGFGIWLGRMKRPLNGIVFAFHKILSMGAVVLWVMNVIYLQSRVGLLITEWWLLGLTALFFLLAIISGALLSFERTSYTGAMITHRVSAILVFFAALLSMYLPANRPG